MLSLYLGEGGYLSAVYPYWRSQSRHLQFI